jgi:hypothetical protein
MARFCDDLKASLGHLPSELGLRPLDPKEAKALLDELDAA